MDQTRLWKNEDRWDLPKKRLWTIGWTGKEHGDYPREVIGRNGQGFLWVLWTLQVWALWAGWCLASLGSLFLGCLDGPVNGGGSSSRSEKGKGVELSGHLRGMLPAITVSLLAPEVAEAFLLAGPGWASWTKGPWIAPFETIGKRYLIVLPYSGTSGTIYKHRWKYEW